MKFELVCLAFFLLAVANFVASDGDNINNPTAQEHLDSSYIRLKLCECERATGDPNGLGCDKEGWFISSFENQGTWMGGGGLVPLSNSICCRPCLPGEDPPPQTPAALKSSTNPVAAVIPVGDPALNALAASHVTAALRNNANLAISRFASHSKEKAAPGQDVHGHVDAVVGGSGSTSTTGTESGGAVRKLQDVVGLADPVAVVSIGCHASSVTQVVGLQCEKTGASFMTGFAAAEHVSSYYYDISYPLGPAQCCTPTVMLHNGGMLPIKRCDCVEVQSKECGGMDTNKLLWGFDSYRMTQADSYLPVAPMLCCGLCIASNATPYVPKCEDLNGCNGHGVCSLGTCQCFNGFTGPSCLDGGTTSSAPMPWWAVSLVVFTGLLFITIGGAGSRHIIQLLCLGFMRRRGGAAADAGAAEEGGDASQPLLLEEEGSAGSRDTSVAGDCDQELDLEEGPAQENDGHITAADAVPADTDGAAAGAHTHSTEQGPSSAAGSSSGAARSEFTHSDEEHVHDGQHDGHVATDEDDTEDEDEGGESGRGVRFARRPNRDSHHGSPAVLSSSRVSATDLIDDVGPSCSQVGGSTIATSACAVCMERPIQVALVPCGHAMVCRRCSRRMQRCPFCRKDIVRRQRLFIAD